MPVFLWKLPEMLFTCYVTAMRFRFENLFFFGSGEEGTLTENKVTDFVFAPDAGF